MFREAAMPDLEEVGTPGGEAVDAGAEITAEAEVTRPNPAQSARRMLATVSPQAARMATNLEVRK